MIRMRRIVALAGALACFCGFATLGTWQLERRVWKLGLIARVEQRVHAAATPAPGRAEWPHVSVARDEYRHVRADGVFRNQAETLVQASTELGPGFWVLTPLVLEDGSSVLINRGFVPPGQRDAASHAAKDARTRVTGLLRITEPGGTLLRKNVPAEDRWYSRDVAAIARARGLTDVAPYFIDEDAASPESGPPPVAGLTVLAFYNNHLVYAVTWYTLALMIPVALWLGCRNRRSS